MKDLTPSQLKVLRFIHVTTLANGVPPSYREISSFLNASSSNAGLSAANRLMLKGMISNNNGKTRCLVLTRLGFDTLAAHGDDLLVKKHNVISALCELWVNRRSMTVLDFESQMTAHLEQLARLAL